MASTMRSALHENQTAFLLPSTHCRNRHKVQGAECRVQGAGFRVQGAGCRVQGARCTSVSLDLSVFATP